MSTTVTMREQMGQTVNELLERDERLVVILAEISAQYFAETSHPERVINVGIMEQAMVSAAAGLALEGFIPVLHSIVPFLVERPFEQIKDDFCYQRLGGNFISIVASYDYSTEGMTHHGSADVPILHCLPSMQIIVPGTAGEFDRLFGEAYANGSPTYYRLSATSNPMEYPVRFGKLEVVQRGSRAGRGPPVKRATRPRPAAPPCAARAGAAEEACAAASRSGWPPGRRTTPRWPTPA